MNTSGNSTPRVIEVHDGDVLIVQVKSVSNASVRDDLMAFPFGLERSAAKKLVRDGVLPSVQIGRKRYAKRSDILALVDTLRPKESVRALPTDPEIAYRELLARRAS